MSFTSGDSGDVAEAGYKYSGETVHSGRAVAKLTGGVAPPTRHRAIGAHRARMITSGRDRASRDTAASAKYNDRRGAGQSRPVTELAGVLAPASCTSIGQKRA